MEFYFNPPNESEFKKQSLGHIVRTIVFDDKSESVVTSFSRKVQKTWEQTCKNNIETDHRIKSLPSGNYHVYSWISGSKQDFALPGFYKIK